MLLPMPAVTRWGRGAGVAGVRAVWHRRRDGKIRAPCMIRGVSAAKRAPSLARSARYAFPKGGLRGFSDTWRAYLAKASSFWMHGGDMLPGRGAFPVRGPFGNASRENIATDGRLGTYHGEILPPPVTRERISRRSCHGRMPGFASRQTTTVLPQNNAKGRIRGMPHHQDKRRRAFCSPSFAV